MRALVRSDTARGVTTITLDSPDNRNALSSALIAQLLDALAAAESDDAVRVVVLDHTGPVFCSGADLYLTGDTFDGTRAAAIGLVTAAVPADELDAAVRRYTGSLVRGAPGALAGTKRLLHGDVDLAARLAPLTELSVRYFGSAEGREGVNAFREKRDPG